MDRRGRGGRWIGGADGQEGQMKGTMGQRKGGGGRGRRGGKKAGGCGTGEEIGD